MHLAYEHGLDILGDGPFYGPESPEDLANADRILTPAEQKAVDDWQSKQADEMAKAEEAKGGPKAQVVDVTEKGAVIAAPKSKPKATGIPYYAPLQQPKQKFIPPLKDEGMPAWQIVLLATGGVVALVGVYAIVKSTGRSKVSTS